MALIKCKFCGYEAADGRVMHGHMMKNHEKEYRESGLDMETCCTGYKRTKSNATKRTKNAEKPAGLRLLNNSDPNEFEAYKQGYRYIDAEESIYTSDELKEMGVI